MRGMRMRKGARGEEKEEERGEVEEEGRAGWRRRNVFMMYS